MCLFSEERRNAYRVLVRKTKGKSPVAISKSRWEYNIAVYLKIICGQCVDVVYGRDIWPPFVNTVPNLHLP